MALHFHFDELPGLLRMEVSGDATLDELVALIDTLAARTRRGRYTRALVSLLAVKEGLKFTDHYSIGEQVARKLGHLEQLASVVPADRRTGTSEKVANRQGMRLRVFVEEGEAMNWLMAAPAPAPTAEAGAAQVPTAKPVAG